MTRTIRWAACAVAIATCAGLIGCSEKKSDDSGSPPAEPKGKGPDGKMPDGTTPAPPAEPKFKVESADFIKEYTTSPRGANAKYVGSLIELKGPVMKPAALETDDFGMVVGEPGSQKAVLMFGVPDGKRIETVIVRGLKLEYLGKILQGQVIRVRGKVAKHQEPNPVAITDAEVVDAGSDPAIPLDYKRFKEPDAREYFAKFENAPARASGTVVSRGKDVTDYVQIKLDSGDKIRCYLMPGTEPLYPSGFEPGMKVSFAGMLRQHVIDKGTPGSGLAYVIQDAVVQHKDPKAKLD